MASHDLALNGKRSGDDQITSHSIKGRPHPPGFPYNPALELPMSIIADILFLSRLLVLTVKSLSITS